MIVMETQPEAVPVVATELYVIVEEHTLVRKVLITVNYKKNPETIRDFFYFLILKMVFRGCAINNLWI